MADDIINKIRKVAPSRIDQFANDVERRNNLTDEKITEILKGVFDRIDVDALSPEMAFRYHGIKKHI